ncbi:MAG TPA: hypothetical protein VGE46_05020 [Bdellovibrio sp.]
MKNFILAALLMLSTSSLNAKEKNSIELGHNLTFTCPDDFNQTTLSVVALSAEAVWDITVYEYDPLGNMISEITSLAGSLKTSGHMEITSSKGHFGTMAQVDEGEALFFRSGRSMKCRFR